MNMQLLLNLTLRDMYWTQPFQIFMVCSMIFGFIAGIYFYGNVLKRYTSKDEDEKKNHPPMDIEYLPNCQKYFPRVNGRYMVWFKSMQAYQLMTSPEYAAFGNTLEEAEKMLKEYLEQERLVKTQIIHPKL